MSKTVKITARDFNLVLCPYTVSWCVRPTAHWQLAGEDPSNCGLRLQLCGPGPCSKITLVTGFIRIDYGLVCSGASNQISYSALNKLLLEQSFNMAGCKLHLWSAKCGVDSRITKLLSRVVRGFVSLSGVGGFFNYKVRNWDSNCFCVLFSPFSFCYIPFSVSSTINFGTLKL